MKKIVLLISLLSLFLAPSIASASDRILVRYLKGTTAAEKKDTRDGAELLNKYTIVPRLELLEVDDQKKTLKELNSDPNVAYALPDINRKTLATPNDTLFSLQWGAKNTGQTILGLTGTAGADIRATNAWDIQTGNSNTDIAVIDSGIQLNHPDLINNLWTNPDEIPGNGIDDDGNGYIDDVHGWNFISDNNNPTDTDGHGTHVAGIIGAQGNNSIGVAGVNWNVSMAALKACENSSCPLSATIEALEYAVNKGFKLSNNSYGGCCGEYAPEKTALENAMAADHLFVAAAGNSNANNDNPAVADYPASYDLANVISVASSTNQEAKSSFSNYGATKVDLFAPGENIASTYIGSDYVYSSGTSMASPQVAGAAAIIKSQKPNWGYEKIKDQILNSSRTVPAYNGLVLTGGILNLGQALLIKPENLTGPGSETPLTTATFTWDAINNATFECRLDVGSFEACSYPKTYTGLAPGNHTFRVKAIYPSGESETTSYTWQVTGVGPPTITSSPGLVSDSKTATFVFSGQAEATFECSLDNEPFSACLSPKTYSNLEVGDHKFEVRQTVESITSDPAIINWSIPEVVDLTPSATGPDQDGFLAFSGAPVGYQYLCQVVNKTILKYCSNPYAPPAPLTNGNYQLKLMIEDPDGYRSGEIVYPFEITGVPKPASSTPSLLINNGAKYTNKLKVNLKIVWPAGAKTMAIKSSGRTEQLLPVASALPWQLAAGNGSKTITIKFSETDGSPIKTLSKTIIFDNVKPVIKKASVKKSKNRYSFRLILKKPDKFAKVYFSKSKKMPPANSLGNTSRRISSARFTFKLNFYPRFVRVRDAAGNLSGWKRVVR